MQKMEKAFESEKASLTVTTIPPVKVRLIKLSFNMEILGVG